MKGNQGYELTKYQAIFFVFSSVFGVGVLSLPQSVSKEAGGDAWIAVLLGGCLPLLAVVLVHMIGRRFPGLTLVEITDAVFGPYLGKIFSLTYIVWIIALLVLDARFFVFMVNNYLLPKTPSWAIMMLLLLGICYLSIESVKILGRISELFFYLLLPLVLLLLPPLKEGNILYLLPIADVGIRGIIKGALASGLAYSGTLSLLVIFPFIKRQEETLGSGLKGIILVILAYLFFVLVCLLVFGSDSMTGIRWPVLVLLKTVEVPVIDRLEFLFLTLWIGVIYRINAIYLFLGSFSIARMCGMKEHRLIVFALLPVPFLATLLGPNILQWDKYTKWVGISGILLDILLPVCLLTGAILLKKRGRQNA